MAKDLFEYLVREKIADGPLIAKWRKPGYEILCSMLAIQKVCLSEGWKCPRSRLINVVRHTLSRGHQALRGRCYYFHARSQPDHNLHTGIDVCAILDIYCISYVKVYLVFLEYQ